MYTDSDLDDDLETSTKLAEALLISIRTISAHNDPDSHKLLTYAYALYKLDDAINEAMLNSNPEPLRTILQTPDADSFAGSLFDHFD